LLPLLIVTALLGGPVSASSRQGAPQAPAGDTQALQMSNGEFAGRLLAKLSQPTSTVAVSPFSVSQALAMALAGARGETAAQIASTLGTQLPAPRFLSAFNDLDHRLARDRGAATLQVANALYGQRGQRFRRPFLDALALYFGAAMRTVDFGSHPNAARLAINRWVSEHTSAKIPQLLSQQDVTKITVFVLVNAVYLKAKWLSPFLAADTTAAAFHTPGGVLRVPTMHQQAEFPYVRGSGYRALELPYRHSRLALDVLLPNPGRLPDLLGSLANTGPLPLLSGLASAQIQLALPKLKLRTHTELAPVLSALGMPLAFTPQADLSGIAGRPGDLEIGAAVHEAYIRVDEAGTEAAAATGLVGVPSAGVGGPIIDFSVNRPFVFVLRDTASGAVLFTGLVSRP
jgi:serpin B